MQNQISPNVTLAEATHSKTAISAGILNQPNAIQYSNMQRLALNILEPLYAHFGKANIGYTSFFRSESLNKKVGGSNTSDHAVGNAIDLYGTGKYNNAAVFNWIRDNLEFDQLIWEYGDSNNPDWVHVGFRENNRNSIVNANQNTDPNKSTTPKTFKPAGRKSSINTITPPSGTGMAPSRDKKSSAVSNKIITVFEHSIELDELSLAATEPTVDDKTPKPEDVASVEYPLIKINDYIFSPAEIESLVIDSTDFLPKITLSVVLISQLFLAKEMPKDGDILSISIRNKADTLRMLRNDYVITSVHTQPNFTTVQKTPSIITFYGELFVPGLKSQIGDKAYVGTTMEVLKEFAHSLNLGFATNEYNTDDKQVWLKANTASDLFIKELTDHAWKDGESFYDSWIDIYYNLNFVNLNMQLMSSEEEINVAALTTNIDKNTYFAKKSDDTNTKITAKIFTNFQNSRTTPFYIKTWRPANKSSYITFQIGTKMTCEMFEHNSNLYQDETSQKYWAIGVNPVYDTEKENSMILLRGRATQEKNSKSLARANYSYIGLYEKFPWLGIQYTISDTNLDNSKWDGNHHRYYQLSMVQNLINNKELEKINLLISVDGTNLNIIKGDKLPIVLMRSDPADNTLIREKIINSDVPDLFYSGWYIVKGFVLSWSNSDSGSVMSNFSQEFILTRREWPTPLPIEGLPAQPVSQPK